MNVHQNARMTPHSRYQLIGPPDPDAEMAHPGRRRCRWRRNGRRTSGPWSAAESFKPISGPLSVILVEGVDVGPWPSLPMARQMADLGFQFLREGGTMLGRGAPPGAKTWVDKMKWLLVVLLAWADAPPVTTLQIPIETKDLCARAAKQVQENLSAGAVKKSLYGDDSGYRRSGVVATCLQVSD